MRAPPVGKRLELSSAPELVFGLVAPVGVDLDLVADVLSQLLREMRYESKLFKLTSLMTEVPIELPLARTPYIESIKDRIKYANEIRNKLGDDALAAMAVSAIRTFREQEWENKTTSDSSSEICHPEEKPLPNYAYIVRQFKRPEEIALFRSVYGRQFITISVYSSQDIRLKRIQEQERLSRGGLISDTESHNMAFSLLTQDANEAQEEHGQNVRDAFPLGDVFIDARSREICESTLRRFIHLIFGDNHITPTHDEYGMYLAKSAALRSSDLSRQVGAAIFGATGEIITLGCNEVPKAGGGTYWCGDPADKRDFVSGFDPNERRKIEILVDFINRLKVGRHLSDSLLNLDDPYLICTNLLSDTNKNGLADSQIMDLLEFGRIIHAEMSAICDASRKGLAIEGSTLYTTTFPCHICAKHIVTAGIRRVVYLEPYPKSYASELHSDSIQVEMRGDSDKVVFEPFIGVSPFRYRELFEKGKRKYSGGLAKKWHKGEGQPIIDVYFPSYFESEAAVVHSISEELESIFSSAKPEPLGSGKPSELT